MGGAVAQGVEVSVSDGVADVCLTRRAGAGWLDCAQRAALLSVITTTTPDVRRIVLRASDRMLAAHPDAGPDLPDTDAAGHPSLASLCHAVESSVVPVIAFLEGLVSGAAADIALAAQARVATPSARIGFPSARLGQISGAGSTQRLPRLVGADHALRLLSGGRPVSASEALAIGLVDQVIDEATPALALAAGIALAVSMTHPPRRAPDGRAFLAAVRAARAEARPGSLAVALADCAEAALLLPPEQGYAFEAALALERDALPQTAALTHVLQAERRAAHVPEALRGVAAPPVQRPALVGAAPQMAALALMALGRGLPVMVLEPDRARLVPMLQTIAARQEAAVQAGTLDAAQREADWARLRPLADAADLDQADLVIAVDAPPVKLRPDVPMLMLGRAELPDGALRVVLAGRVAELGLPTRCGAQAAAQAFAFLRRIGQTVVLTGLQSPAGISGRLAGAGGAALRALVASGVAQAQIHAALTGFGVTHPALPPPDAAATPRAMPAEEIVGRWMGAMANEGARLLATGMAHSALDVDLVAVHGLGLPATCGGPLHWADQRGLMILRRDLRLWGEEAAVWVPVPAFDQLISSGQGLVGRVS